MSWLSKIFNETAKDWFYAQIPSEQTPEKIESKIVNRDEEYIQIFLKSMRIVNVRKGLSKFYPTVHSHIELGHKSGKLASFNFVTTPGTLEALDSNNIDKVINMNRRLLGPVPYRGGGIKMESGLFSIKEENLAEPFIKLLTNMSTLGGVSILGTALPYLKPIEDGIEMLTGSAGNSILEIGLTKEFDVVNTGYYVVMKAEKDRISANDLTISKDDFRLIDKNGNTIKDFPYMVFQISSSPYREDYYNIPELSVIFNKLQQELRDDKKEDAIFSLATLKRMLLTSDDLLLKDAKLIYEKVEKDANEILKPAFESTKENKILKEFDEYLPKNLNLAEVR